MYIIDFLYGFLMAKVILLPFQIAAWIAKNLLVVLWQLICMAFLGLVSLFKKKEQID